jgi:hypothetical protein
MIQANAEVWDSGCETVDAWPWYCRYAVLLHPSDFGELAYINSVVKEDWLMDWHAYHESEARDA